MHFEGSSGDEGITKKSIYKIYGYQHRIKRQLHANYKVWAVHILEKSQAEK